MAEGVGFEPTAQGLPVHGISSAAPSAARSPLRSCDMVSSVQRPTVERQSPAQPLRRQRRMAEGSVFEPPRDLLGPYPISNQTPSTGLGHPSAHRQRRRLSKPPRSSPAPSPASTPPTPSTRWFRRPSSSSRYSDSTAPALGSRAPYTTRASRPFTIAPLHIGHGSTVT